MPVKVFCSYSHQDRDLKEKLKEHLSTLQRKGRIIAYWSDEKLTAGTEFDPVINSELEEADVISEATRAVLRIRRIQCIAASPLLIRAIGSYPCMLREDGEERLRDGSIHKAGYRSHRVGCLDARQGSTRRGKRHCR